jgi:hypothetical protein
LETTRDIFRILYLPLKSICLPTACNPYIMFVNVILGTSGAIISYFKTIPSKSRYNFFCSLKIEGIIGNMTSKQKLTSIKKNVSFVFPKNVVVIIES